MNADDFLSPEIRAKRAAGKRTLRCQCCGDAYVVGHFKCCAPQAGMASHKWLAIACRKIEDGGCGKCFRHCTCHDKEKRNGVRPLENLAEIFLGKFTPPDPEERPEDWWQR